MKRTTAGLRRAAVGVPAAVAGASWHLLAALVLVLLIVVMAGCWAIADNGRARRLALLIRACHNDPSLPLVSGRQAPARRGQRPTG